MGRYIGKDEKESLIDCVSRGIMPPKKLAKAKLGAKAAVAKPAGRGRAASAARQQPIVQQPRGRSTRGRATRESSASEPDSEEDDAAVRQMEQLIAAEDAARAGGRHAAALKAPAAGQRAGKPALQLEDVTILRDQLHVADLEAVARQEEAQLQIRSLTEQLEVATAGAMAPAAGGESGGTFFAWPMVRAHGAGACVGHGALCVERQGR